MEENESTSMESTESSSTESTESTETPSQESTEATESTESGETTETAAAVPSFAADYKFKVMDKDHEIPEMFRGLIKDEDTQKQVREVFEKAYGLDWHKPKYEAMKNQQAEWERGINTLSGFAQDFTKKGDISSFDNLLKFFGVGKDHVVKYLAEKFKYDDMTPEQKAQYDYQQRQAQEHQYFSGQSQALQQELSQAKADMRSHQLDMALGSPSMLELVKAYDSRVGQPGAFRDEVIRQGKLAYYESGGKEDLSVQEAITRASRYLKFVEGQQAPSQQAPAKVVAPVAQKKLPVIPNVGAGGGSPVNKSINSIADLRKIRSEMTNQ